MNIRRELLKIRPIVWLSSVKLTVVCLCLLFVLTLGGTVAQIQDGLYWAQQRYFESFFFLAFGFLPFPGAQSVMWVLFVNLVCVLLVRFTFQWQRAGILIIHGGLMLFLVSAYVTLHSATESQLTLEEGQAANVSVAYHEWEIALWEDAPQSDRNVRAREVTALDADHLKSGQRLEVGSSGVAMTVKSYDRNCRVKSDHGDHKEFEPLALVAEVERNTPCAVITVKTSDQRTFDLYLSGDIDEPESFAAADRRMNALLRLKRYPLPFTLKLKDFRKEEHPGTDTPRSFQSLVEVEENKVWREKLIAMNEPLRFNEYTIYQASFADGGMGRQVSTLAVVKNAGRLMPYISTFVTFLGLALHFGMAALRSKRKTGR